ncbi:MAG TPA: hypothetical protein VF874_02255, partial [Mycobacterium sp.]
VCITHPDVAKAVAYVADNGGTILSQAAAFVPGWPWLLAYVADPCPSLVWPPPRCLHSFRR